MKKYWFVASLLFVLFACHSAADSKTAVKTDTVPAVQATPDVAAALANLHFDYSKDPACGMPLKAGLEDTTTYKGKLYGFCSKECKDAFLTDPAGYTAKLK